MEWNLSTSKIREVKEKGGCNTLPLFDWNPPSLRYELHACTLPWDPSTTSYLRRRMQLRPTHCNWNRNSSAFISYGSKAKPSLIAARICGGSEFILRSGIFLITMVRMNKSSFNAICLRLPYRGALIHFGFKVIWKVRCRFFGRGNEEEAVKDETDCGHIAKNSNDWFRVEHPSHVERGDVVDKSGARWEFNPQWLGTGLSTR